MMKKHVHIYLTSPQGLDRVSPPFPASTTHIIDQPSSTPQHMQKPRADVASETLLERLQRQIRLQRKGRFRSRFDLTLLQERRDTPLFVPQIKLPPLVPDQVRPPSTLKGSRSVMQRRRPEREDLLPQSTKASHENIGLALFRDSAPSRKVPETLVASPAELRFRPRPCPKQKRTRSSILNVPSPSHSPLHWRAVLLSMLAAKFPRKPNSLSPDRSSGVLSKGNLSGSVEATGSASPNCAVHSPPRMCRDVGSSLVPRLLRKNRRPRLRTEKLASLLLYPRPIQRTGSNSPPTKYRPPECDTQTRLAAVANVISRNALGRWATTSGNRVLVGAEGDMIFPAIHLIG